MIAALNAAGGGTGPIKFIEPGCEIWQVRR
jgi:hypothetical protein